jgi:putative glycosyltransferase
LLIGGLLLSFNGIIAIYVGTIFLEVKQRPRTIVRSVTRFYQPGG